ncbi:hypothetical protein GCM10010492_22740 [Saccharothrix mutabilis subsp. mutabilis]|uniref:Uncharacterized protein n=1 Tax=Saccharothrix mutabilis subsp. mutabilis TaxID=66855 RepID=A0ABN0TKL1_9PSEU
MTDTEDELRRMLAARADRVRSTLTGPAIRARAAARPRALRRFAPLVTGVAVVLAVVVASLLLVPGPRGEDRPATSVPAGDPRPTVTTTTEPPTTTFRPTTTTPTTTTSPPTTTTPATTTFRPTTTWPGSPTVTTTR